MCHIRCLQHIVVCMMVEIQYNSEDKNIQLACLLVYIDCWGRKVLVHKGSSEGMLE